jgi:flagellar M-ring protein FliF
MELTKTENGNALPVTVDNNEFSSNLPMPMQGMIRLPVLKQVGLLIGLAASIALGFYVVLWTQKPDYSLLYANVTGLDTQQMILVLDQYDIKYQLDVNSGTLMVESARLNDAKLKLAAENLTASSGQGFELIDKDQGFGSSAFIQSARYKRAQEVELARTITSIATIKSARVHLALPRDSAFIRNRRKASVSVMVSLLPGRKLESGQINAIINLVSASVPDVESKYVTLVDDKGRLLSSTKNNEVDLSNSQFEYSTKLEQAYVSRIESILSPLVGLSGVRAQVNVNVDFTRTESTTESFNPDLPAIRSEQNFEESSTGGLTEGGVPGALSNQPPGTAQAPEVATNNAAATPGGTTQPSRSRKRSTRNYELDKTISHTRRIPGEIRNLSVAVVLDVPSQTNDKGIVTQKPYTNEEIARFTSLVKEAVGFSAIRGDTVNVVNVAFKPIEQIEVLDVPIWEQNWFWSIIKQVVGGLLVLVLLFGVIRPVMRSLSTHASTERVRQANGDELSDDQLTLSDGSSTGRLPKPTSYEDNKQMAQQMASSEPKRVAQVIKGWIEE